jgi:hypothetical protein
LTWTPTSTTSTHTWRKTSRETRWRRQPWTNDDNDDDDDDEDEDDDARDTDASHG